MQWLIPYIASSDRATSVWASREFLYDSNKSLIYYGDGATLGGIPLMTGSTAGVLPAISGSNGSFTYSTASFGNLNGISFYTSNGSLVASHNGITTAMASNAGSNFVWASASLHLTNVSATVQSNNISLSVAPPGAMSISGGTSSAALGSVVFTNANGVSFHLNGSTMSGSVKTDYIQTSQSSLFQHTSATSNITSNALNTSQSSLFQQTSLMTDYLGTAATQSFRHTSADTQLLFTSQSSLFQLTADNSLSLGTGYTTHTHSQYLNTSQSSLFQHTSNTSNITSNALNTSQSSLFEHTSHTTVFLTTQSNQAFSAANGSQTFQTIKFVDGQGVSFSTDTNGINATVRTDYQSSGNYLTTARASNDAIGLNTALTANGVSWTVNSSGLSLNVPAFLTTAMQSNQSSNFVNTSQSSLFQHTSATSNITSNALNTSQSSLFQATSLMSDYLTTAAKSNEVVNSINGSTGQFSFNTASSLSSSRNGNSISFGLASNITTALQSAGAYLTTARASNDGVGLNTAQSNVTWSVNSSGLSLDARGYAGTQTTFAGTNVSASATLNSLGLNLALSANVGGGGGSINFSAGTTSANLASVTFNDSNGVSFGLNAGTITATVRTDYQSSGNYLTTAALSNHSHNFATTTTNGSQIVVLTTNSVGATIGVPSFITTAMQSGESSNFVNTSQSSLFQHTSATSNITSNALNTSVSSRFIQNWKLTGNTAGTTSSAQGSDLWLAGGNGVTISGSNNTLSFSVATNYQSQGAYLTTARASNDGIGLNTALTANGVSWTVNSSGLSLNVPAFLTTAMQSNQSSNFVNTSQSSLFQHTSATSAITSNAFPSANTTKFAGTGTTTAGTNISLSVTLNSNGLNLAASAGAGGGGGVGLANSQTTYTSGTVHLSGAGAITIGSTTGQSYQFSVPQTSSIVAAGALTISTSGNTITLSGATAAPSPVGVSAGTTSASLDNLVFINSHGVSFGLNGSSITASHDGLTTARASNDAIGLNTAQTNVTWTVNSSGISINAGAYLTTQTNPAVSGSNGSFTYQTLSFADLNNFTFYTTNSSIAISGQGGFTREFYNPYGDQMRLAGAVGQGTMNINPNDFPNLTFDRILIPINHSNATNSSGSQTLSFWVGIYTRNVSTLSLLTSASQSYAITASGTVGSYSLYSGIRHVSIPISTSLSEGVYYLGVLSRTTSAGANATYSQMLISNLNSNFNGHFGSSHNTSMQLRPGIAIYSATLSSIPNAISLSQLNGQGGAVFRPPLILFANSTI
jgi:hypothetical protein